jgi:hypothetical protein
LLVAAAMRASLAAALLLALSARAAADDEPLAPPADDVSRSLHAATRATATHTAAGDAAATTLEVGADASAATTFGGGHIDPVDDPDHPQGGLRAFVGAIAALRLSAGALPGIGYRLGGSMGLVDVARAPGGPHVMVMPFRVDVIVDRGDVPVASASRELLSGPYDREEVAVATWFDRGGTGRWDLGWFAVTVAITTTSQRTADGATVSVDDARGTGDIYTIHHSGPDDRVDVRLGSMRLASARGTLPVSAGDVAPVAFDVAIDRWRLAARVGWLEGEIDLPGWTRATQDRCDHIGTCVTLDRFAYDAHAGAPIGDADLDLHAARLIAPTMDGELVIEDRVEAALAWKLDDVALGAHAFAARARLYRTDGGRLARAPDELTGGADVTAGFSIEDWQVAATAGAARTDYAALDGAAPAPALAATGTLSIRRDWKDALAAR